MASSHAQSAEAELLPRRHLLWLKTTGAAAAAAAAADGLVLSPKELSQRPMQLSL
jgi:hypothetical protein